MAGQLTIDTLKASSGVLATQNGMTGIAKAWCYYNGSTQTVVGSFNVSSVTYNSTGDYTFNFTTAMANATYAVAGSSWNAGVSAGVLGVKSQTTSACTTNSVQTSTGTLTNYPFVSVAILGS